MRKAGAVLLVLLLVSLPVYAEPLPCGLRADADFVLLTEGVQAGIAPQPPTLRLLVIRRANGEAAVYRSEPTGFREGTAKDYDALERRLTTLGLPALPHEGEAFGAFDLYGRKTAVHWHDGGKCWYTQPPSGCLLGPKTLEVTDEQKKQFDTIVRAVEAQGKSAGEPSSQERFGKAYSTLVAPR